MGKSLNKWDYGSNFKKAVPRIMKKYGIYWIPTTAHCINLMLKDFGRRSW